MNKTILAFLFLFPIGNFTYAQTDSENKIYQSYDMLVSLENTGLYNGTEFKDPFLKTDGSFRYFNKFNFTEGTITYNNQVYYNVLLRYDLLEDNIITRSNDNLSIFQVKLLPGNISSFSIYGHDFTRLPDVNLDLEGNHFFEISYRGESLDLYVKHIKKKREKALKSGIQYKFTDDNYYLLKNGKDYFIINSVKDIRKAIPDYDEQIREFYKSYKKLFQSSPNGFMVKLVKYLDGLAKNSNQ